MKRFYCCMGNYVTDTAKVYNQYVLPLITYGTDRYVFSFLLQLMAFHQ